MVLLHSMSSLAQASLGLVPRRCSASRCLGLPSRFDSSATRRRCSSGLLARYHRFDPLVTHCLCRTPLCVSPGENQTEGRLFRTLRGRAPARPSLPTLKAAAPC
ncbi:hypothetical protein PYCCODRAFT_1007469 [Trametes coccinea BRFM310]|uniref:Uncharacterized protein n=1 Tax=Trametes coccinea (strain BRFM310) TaxID=1353009 RepID=A0A1Y2ID18_TRAC3|nr:hypothetical protein PYCCODRAFT_1007469 [Trametes coccinea BRFM310]